MSNETTFNFLHEFEADFKMSKKAGTGIKIFRRHSFFNIKNDLWMPVKRLKQIFKVFPPTTQVTFEGEHMVLNATSDRVKLAYRFVAITKNDFNTFEELKECLFK